MESGGGIIGDEVYVKCLLSAGPLDESVKVQQFIDLLLLGDDFFAMKAGQRAMLCCL
jgi:hypothetical protein